MLPRAIAVASAQPNRAGDALRVAARGRNDAKRNAKSEKNETQEEKNRTKNGNERRCAMKAYFISG